MLREDIGMRNGILRRRFLRELNNLKRVADYSSCDPTNLNHFLQVKSFFCSLVPFSHISSDKTFLLSLLFIFSFLFFCLYSFIYSHLWHLSISFFYHVQIFQTVSPVVSKLFQRFFFSLLKCQMKCVSRILFLLLLRNFFFPTTSSLTITKSTLDWKVKFKLAFASYHLLLSNFLFQILKIPEWVLHSLTHLSRPLFVGLSYFYNKLFKIFEIHNLHKKVI